MNDLLAGDEDDLSEAELLLAATVAAEARGYRKAITALRERSQQLSRSNNLGSWSDGIQVDLAADYLETIAEEGK